MKNERCYLKCEICGNLLGFISDSGVAPECCGQPMEVLEPNTVDAAHEKHLPVITREGDKVRVTVGSVAHPMTPEHLIEWIALAQGNWTQRVALSPTDKPEAEFCCQLGSVTVYAYCNLHGLWVSEQ